MFKIPARIVTVDYIGVSTAESNKLRSFVLTQLEILHQHMQFNDLRQDKRTVTTKDNIKVECHISFNVAQATVVIGANSTVSVDEYACFCTVYGLLAGRITELYDEVSEPDTVMDHYEDDDSYAADVIMCQKTGTGTPKIIEVREIRESGGNRVDKLQATKTNAFWISNEFLNIPFTDRYPHEPGELVLVLAMPLVDYRPTNQEVQTYGMSYTEKFGCWSPEVNRRRVVSYSIENPKAQITNQYTVSTGLTHVLTADFKLWDNAQDGDIKYTPFRILPLSLDSCFNSYKHNKRR